MRKLSFILAILCILLSVPAFAQQAVTYGAGQATVFKAGQAMVMSGSSGGSCSTQQDDNLLATSSGTVNIGYDTNHQAIAGNFTPANSYTLCQVQLRMQAIGSPTASIQVAIYTNSSGSPGVQVGTASASINTNTLTASEATYTFTGLSASVTSGTQYWIVILVTSGSFTAYTNYAQWDYSTNVVTDSTDIYNGSVWSVETTYNKVKFRTFSH